MRRASRKMGFCPDAVYEGRSALRCAPHIWVINRMSYHRLFCAWCWKKRYEGWHPPCQGQAP